MLHQLHLLMLLNSLGLLNQVSLVNRWVKREIAVYEHYMSCYTILLTDNQVNYI